MTGRTRVYGIIGDPVVHSLSPLMQNAAFRELAIDAVYVPFQVKPAEISSAIIGIRSLGIAGFNVTIPHKISVIGLLEDLSREASLIGAVNTVVREGESLVGHNTDAQGFINSLRDDLDYDPSGSRVLLLGAGGAARAALVSLSQAGISEVTVANRTSETAEEMMALLRRTGAATTGNTASLQIFADADRMQSFDLVVNTTSIGMGGTSLPGFSINTLHPDAKIYDMVYVPSETPLIQAARNAGHSAANGIGMLAAQGEAAFRLWTGYDPPQGLMKASLLNAIGAKT